MPKRRRSIGGGFLMFSLNSLCLCGGFSLFIHTLGGRHSSLRLAASDGMNAPAIPPDDLIPLPIANITIGVVEDQTKNMFAAASSLRTKSATNLSTLKAASAARWSNLTATSSGKIANFTSGGVARLSNLTASSSEKFTTFTSEGKLKLSNITATSNFMLTNLTATGAERLSNFTSIGSARLGNLTALGNQRLVNFAMRLKMPQMPERLKKAEPELAVSDLGLSIEAKLGTVWTRLRRLQAQQEARERVSGEEMLLEESKVLPVTDLSLPDRRIWVVTTAALPWMTGTSVNPLLRAAYLAKGRGPKSVSMMVPWVQAEDQDKLFPDGLRFSSPSEQSTYLREWLVKAGMEAEAEALDIVWYPARYLEKMGSIFPMGDITQLIPDDEADMCIMEEPEHINWYRATGSNWSKKFRHVVGIIHTNYIHYAAQDKANWGAQMKGPWVRGFNKLMARAYCDKVIKLSATLQKFAEEKEVVCNVHGVRERFLQVGDQAAEEALKEGGKPFSAGAYFLGKMLWEKGYERLWDLMAESSERLGACFPIDVYGSGPDRNEIVARAEERGLPCTFFSATDHATLSQYRLFVNPSVSEVLCTTVAEALAMGKWVVCARHPSNEFFYQFPNCLPFTGEREFAANIWKALTTDPEPLSAEMRFLLSWEAANLRLIESAKVTVGESKARRKTLDEMAWVLHYNLGNGARGDTVRKMLQAGVISDQNSFAMDTHFSELSLDRKDKNGESTMELIEVQADASLTVKQA